MNANELADLLDFDAKTLNWKAFADAATMLRQQQAEIEALKNANRFIQNFAEEQHQRAVALEMRELTDEEILKMAADKFHYSEYKLVIDFARATLKKASEK